MCRSPSLSWLAAFVIAAAAAVTFSTACGDLKSATGDEGADAGGETGATSASDGAAGDASVRGPGPHGSLPTGYCCNDDSECRYRRCVDTTGTGGAGKMCLDECFTQVFCTRPDITFTCVQPDAGQRGLCQPPGSASSATGSGPLVCTNRCASQADCPGGFVCNPFGTSKACVPAADGYTCN